MKINIFYSWQSDLPKEKTHNIIEYILKTILAEISLESEQELVLDESTRNEPGSPEIPNTIFSKIGNADIFVADISIINSKSVDIRRVPNPNVLIELGYAISILGWERILLIYNTDFGKIEDLPFDISKNRVIRFKIEGKDDKSNIGNLKAILSESIKLILEKNPQKNRIQLSESEEEIKRSRDINNLKMILGTFHLGTMDEFIENLPDRIKDRVFSFWEYFHSNYDQSSFYIYDNKLSSLLKEFRDLWEGALSSGEYYRYIDHGKYYLFSLKMDVFEDEKQEKAYDKLKVIRKKLYKALNDLLEYVRKTYYEIDLEKRSHDAMNAYIQMEKESLESFNDS